MGSSNTGGQQSSDNRDRSNTGASAVPPRVNHIQSNPQNGVAKHNSYNHQEKKVFTDHPQDRRPVQSAPVSNHHGEKRPTVLPPIPPIPRVNNTQTTHQTAVPVHNPFKKAFAELEQVPDQIVTEPAKKEVDENTLKNILGV